MAIYIKKKVNGVAQDPKRVGVIPNGYPARKISYADGTNLQEALNNLCFECHDVTFTFSNSSASAPVDLSTITNIPFEKIKYINFISFGMIGVFNGIGNGSQYYCSNFAGTPITGDYLAKCLIVYES